MSQQQHQRGRYGGGAGRGGYGVNPDRGHGGGYGANPDRGRGGGYGANPDRGRGGRRGRGRGRDPPSTSTSFSSSAPPRCAAPTSGRPAPGPPRYFPDPSPPSFPPSRYPAPPSPDLSRPLWPSEPSPSPSPSPSLPLPPSRMPQSDSAPEPDWAMLLPSEKVSQLNIQDAPESSSGGANKLICPKRPPPGRAGQRALVRANHFLVKISSGITIYQYDVDIKPPVTSKAMCRLLQRQLLAIHSADFGGINVVYDGSKILYSPGALPFSNKDFRVVLTDNGREREFVVSVRQVAVLNSSILNNFLQGRSATTPQEHLHALDIALREAHTLNFTPVARSFFTRDMGEANLGGGLVSWNGFFQSLRPTAQGLAINVDLATTAFYESIPIIEFLRKKFRQFNPNVRLNDTTRALVKKAIVRLKVEVFHRQTPRKYRICGLSPSPAKNTKFTLDEGREIGIIEYFKTTYNYDIHFIELPCIQVQAKKTSYLPMEVCRICAGQKYVGKLEESQTSNLRSMACVRPREREQTIRTIMNRADGPGRGEFVKAFGMEVSPELAVVNARILRPPKLKYGGNGPVQEIEPRFGAWNLMDSCVIEGGNVENWALISFDESINFHAAKDFIGALTRRCFDLGLSLPQQTVIPPVSCRRSDLEMPRLEATLKNVFAQATQAIRSVNPRGYLGLLVCIMSDKHVAYGDLKRICETDLGVVSQCCLSRHVRQSKSQYLANLALKINAKVGGKNNSLVVQLPQLCPMFSRPAMIFGADVTHPNPGDDKSPSIAAVVANCDWPSAIQYVATVRAQKHRVELIVNLKEMVCELWRKFCEKSGLRPEQIIMFRDGVSEGQFDSVLQHEVRALKDAVKAVGGDDYNPSITWIVVQKRHHTRLFPADNNKDKSNNVVPGTVVDTVITHPREFDFYLCSHAGIQGTSKPTRYYVLWDECGFTSDSIQMLINNMCYTYVRCTRAVSVVPPAYYAHLAAYRARLWVEGGYDSSSSSVGSSSRSTRADTGADVRPLPLVKKNVQEVMYFC